MYLALQHLRFRQRVRPEYLVRNRRVRKNQRLTAGDRRRYIWQAVWIVIVLLVACVMGGLLGYYYTD